MLSYSNSPMVITMVLMKERPAFRKGETFTSRLVIPGYMVAEVEHAEQEG